MKKTFSKHWKASKQPRKQRKYLAKAPLHIKRKFLVANLSKELRKKYNRRNFVLRKDDVVKIMVGSFKKKTGKISEIDLRRKKVSIEGIQRAKKDGTKVNLFFDSSNLQIQELNLDDKERIKSIERKIKKESSLDTSKSKDFDSSKTESFGGARNSKEFRHAQKSRISDKTSEKTMKEDKKINETKQENK